MPSTIRRPRKAHPYYEYNKVLSYNGTYNFIVGGRGLGKTFGGKKKAFNDFIKTGDQFIYLRRYKPELAASKQTFFADIMHEFPNYDFRVSGGEAQIAPKSDAGEKTRAWLTMGYFIALSQAQANKSVSFHNVKTIIFDEFIIEVGNSHYISNEATVFNNFYSTVDRWQDKTKVFFLANSVSIMNPYFMEYNIKPDETGKEFVTSNSVVVNNKKKFFIVCHFPDAENFKNSVYETAFGQFIKETEYANYAVGNEFADNAGNLINAKGAEARYLFSLETKKGKFSVWINSFTRQYFVQAKIPKTEVVYTMLPDKMSEDKILMSFSDLPLAQLRTAFRQGRVLFDEPQTRNAFTEISKR